MKYRLRHCKKTTPRMCNCAVILLWTMLWLFLFPPCAGADMSEISRLLDAFLMKSNAQGAQVAIMHKNDSQPSIISKGTANLSNTVPMTNAHILKIGSVTKLFTAACIHKLIEEKKLTYETPISTFFPKFPNGSNIQIRHLLSHTSGLAEMLAIEDIFQNMCKPLTPEVIIDRVADSKPSFAPGTNQKYCNSGYLMLARIVEKVTGQPFKMVLQQSVLAPLNMHHTRQGDDFQLVEKEATGYSENKEGDIVKAVLASMVLPFGTGNFISNAGDIVRFVHLGRVLKKNFIDNLQNDFWILDNGKPAFKSETYQNLMFKQGFHNGYTIFRFTRPEDMTLVGKAGMFPGFCAWFLYDAKTRYGIAVTVNNERKTMDALELAVNIFQYKRRQSRVRIPK